MEVKQTFILTQRECKFLVALKNKKHFPNQYGGWMEDDKFRKEWDEEIKVFQDNNLIKGIDSGPDTYWRKKLTDVGLKLQESVIKYGAPTHPITLDIT